MKFYICKHCGNITTYMEESGVPIMCCGKKMEELIPGTSDGAFEKHIPKVTIDNNKVLVEIGEVEHPMVDAHYIKWIIIETTDGIQIKRLQPNNKPIAEFRIKEGSNFIAAYEYCNLHGLWKK